MNRLNNICAWIFISALVLLIIMVSLYVASILIPILVVVMLVSGAVNLLASVYNKKQFEQMHRQGPKKNNAEKNIEVIDVEYEVIDDGK